MVSCALRKGNYQGALAFGLAVAVGLTPQMLPMIVTTNLARGAALMRAARTVVRRLDAVQSLGAMCAPARMGACGSAQAQAQCAACKGCMVLSVSAPRQMRSRGARRVLRAEPGRRVCAPACIGSLGQWGVCCGHWCLHLATLVCTLA